MDDKVEQTKGQGGPDMADEPSHFRAERSGVNRKGYLTNRLANTRADE